MSSPVFARPMFGKDTGPSVSTSYGSGGVHTTMGREGIDIGLPPNFEAMFSRFRPPRAEQAEALRAPAPPPMAPARESTTRTSGPGPLEYAPRPKDYGRYMMNNNGNWGTMVDAADVPVGSGIAPGFYGSLNNWDSSSPMIIGHPAYGKNSQNPSNGTGGVSVSQPLSADQADALRGVDPNSGSSYLPGAEAQRWHDALTRSNAEIAARSGKG